MRAAKSLAVDWLDNVAERAEYAVVGPTDNRVHEIHTARFPFNTLCHVERDFGDGRWRGCSGVLIDRRRVLTAAHCLYNLLLGRAPVRLRVSPGRRDRDSRPFGSHPAVGAYVPAAFIGGGATSGRLRQHYDYGVVQLSRSFPGIDQFMPLQAPSDEELEVISRGGLITIAGYPGDRPIGTLWRHSEKLKRWTPRRLLYTVDTCPGHSGSPIWHGMPQTGVRRIIGVHTSGIVDERGRPYGCGKDTVLAPPGLLNSGVRLITEVISNIQDPERAVGGRRPMAQVL